MAAPEIRISEPLRIGGASIPRFDENRKKKIANEEEGEEERRANEN